MTLRFRLITLNGMKVSEEISEEQSRQVGSLSFSRHSRLIRLMSFLQLMFDVEHAYAEFFRYLSGGKDANDH